MRPILEALTDRARSSGEWRRIYDELQAENEELRAALEEWAPLRVELERLRVEHERLREAAETAADIACDALQAMASQEDTAIVVRRCLERIDDRLRAALSQAEPEEKR